MLASFGAGTLWSNRQDTVYSTPTQFGVLQGIDLDFSYATKPIFGQNMFAVFVARGEAKWTAKAKAGVVSGTLFNNVFFGQTIATGIVAQAIGELQVVATTSPYTATPTHQATFSSDLGVTNTAQPPIPFGFSSTAPSSTQYEVSSTGLYTFSSALAGVSVYLNYLYTSTTAQKIQLINQLLGVTPYFQAVFRNRDAQSGLYETLVLNRVTSSKLSMSSKTTDYMIREFDMEVLDDGTGNIGTYSFGDLS